MNETYAQRINASSFVDYLLLSELMQNADAYRSSGYFVRRLLLRSRCPASAVVLIGTALAAAAAAQYKDAGDAAPLYAGPLWDMNIAFGMPFFYGAARTDGWRVHAQFRRDEVRPPPTGAASRPKPTAPRHRAD